MRLVAVTNSEDNQYQDEAKEEFDAHSLHRGEVFVEGGEAEVALIVDWGQSLE